MVTCLHSVPHHYGIMGEHFRFAEGYETYALGAEASHAARMKERAKAYIEGQIPGTPDARSR